MSAFLEKSDGIDAIAVCFNTRAYQSYQDVCRKCAAVFCFGWPFCLIKASGQFTKYMPIATATKEMPFCFNELQSVFSFIAFASLGVRIPRPIMSSTVMMG